MKKLVLSALTAVALMAAPQTTSAASITFSGSSGALSASAMFDFTGDILTITLTNAAALGSALDPGAMLTGLTFDLLGADLIPLSASVEAGAIANGSNCDQVVGGCTAATTNVGGEFSYYDAGNTQWIASAGYIPGNGSSGNFGGSSLQSPDSLNGVEFGIADCGYVDGSGNGGVENQALIRCGAVFTLSGVGAYSIGDLSNVLFRYGTDLSEPVIPGDSGEEPELPAVPEPTSFALLGFGGLLLVSRRFLLRKK